ncbi:MULTISPECIES: hypothetical protein [Bacillaceae]|uniref:hypothetical protein n=1 Tax=Bacillaceae TaxID=186817 RepID=UPI0008E392E7|nr:MULTISPECIES: hypothetical protein [Bacillaceae]SFD30641.1 hypothetical protein SAMN02799633_03409 [Bacillus sp. UNCCL81]
MTENTKQDGLLKGVVKGLKEGLTFGSVLDPDMSQKKVEETREFSTKEKTVFFST